MIIITVALLLRAPRLSLCPAHSFFSLPVRPFPRDEMLTAVDGPGIKPQSPRATGSAVERCQPQITRG